jgi:hypothetical protein
LVVGSKAATPDFLALRSIPAGLLGVVSQRQVQAVDLVGDPRRQVLQDRLVIDLVQPKAVVVLARQRHGRLAIVAGQGHMVLLLGGLGQVVGPHDEAAGALVEAVGPFAPLPKLTVALAASSGVARGV